MRQLQPRRGFIRGLFACACIPCGAAAPAAEAPRARRYCMDRVGVDADAAVSLNDFSAAELAEYLRRVIGHVQREHEILAEFFEFKADVFLEPNGRDAHAQPGTVTLGLKFLQRYAPVKGEVLSISGILAHENGHVFQYKYNLDSMLEDLRGHKKKFIELHADYLAGAFMAWREKKFPAKVDELAQVFYDLGDRAMTSEDHHGTETERFYAYATGYHDFRKLKEQRRAEDVTSAAAMGVLYVQKLLSRN